jgi:hypothetical protein
MNSMKKAGKKSNSSSDIVIGILLGIVIVIVAVAINVFIVGVSSAIPVWLIFPLFIIVPLIISYLISKRWNLRVTEIAFAVSMIIIIILFLHP